MENQTPQTTFVMLKPDALERGLAGEIIARLERKGLKLLRMETRLISAELAEKHYAEHVGKPFFPKLAGYVRRGPVVASVWKGRDAVAVV
ncbi:MAG: nucleoside-diphosphate kinase, partial [Thermoguttaceae bacterium]|nr:nucleoside-diphosphate kinase [Thermoguttaceae bacterium]